MHAQASITVTLKPDRPTGIGPGIVLISVPLLSMMGAILMAPLLPRLGEHFHAMPHAELLVPLLLTVPALCQALLSPVAGVVVDRIGSRRVLYVGLFVYGLAGVAPVALDSFSAIFACRVLVGLTEAALVTASTTLLAHYFSGDVRQRWFAYQQALLPLCLVLLLQLTGHLGDGNWHATFLAYSVSWIMLLGALSTIRSEPARGQASVPKGPLFPPWRKAGLLFAITVPMSILFYVAPVEVGFLLKQRGHDAPSTVANALAIGVLAGPFGALLTRRLTGLRFGVVLAGSALVMALGLVLLALSAHVAGMVAGVALGQFAGCTMFVTAMTFMTGMAPPLERGRYAGGFWFFYLGANLAAPLVTGALRALTGTHAASVLGVAVLSLGPILWFLGSRHMKGTIVPAA